MTTRRVVTGFDADGAAEFVSDDHLDELQNANTQLTSYWRHDGDELRIPPIDNAKDDFGFPVPGGAWVLAWSVPPNCVAGETSVDGNAPTKAGELPTGGAHATDSIDVNFVLSGQAVFQLEDGSEKVLDAGDSIVVNGVSHTWHNRQESPVRILSLIFGANRLAV
jgi:mannose-6-phosphate isomerase-like protein (cupin superfamily)